MDKNSVYSKTAKGLAELKTSTRNLSREQVKALVMINGKTSIGEFTASFSEGGRSSFIATVRDLDAMGLVRAAPVPRQGSGDDEFGTPGAALPVIEVNELSGEESVQAWAEARRGALGLKEKGFFAHKDKGGGALPTASGKRQALVVEDDEALAQLLEMLLSEKGFGVTVAASMPAALSTLAGERDFDLVLLDVLLPGMPGKDGFHLLEYIRRTPRLGRLPVIMVTSQISDEYVLRGLKAGSDGYIFKPFKWEALYHCIRSVIGV